jgi:hypothetical protein
MIEANRIKVGYKGSSEAYSKVCIDSDEEKPKRQQLCYILTPLIHFKKKLSDNSVSVGQNQSTKNEKRFIRKTKNRKTKKI